MSSKACFKCLVVKPLSDFYKHPMMGDGHLGKCKECAKADVRAHRAANLERIQEYDRMRGGLDYRKAFNAARAKTPDGAKIAAKAKAEWAARNQEKIKAERAAANAVRNGRLVRGPCETCGTTNKVQGHHDDYTKPLDVRWLCPKHHAEHHKKHREAARIVARALAKK